MLQKYKRRKTVMWGKIQRQQSENQNTLANTSSAQCWISSREADCTQKKTKTVEPQFPFTSNIFWFSAHGDKETERIQKYVCWSAVAPECQVNIPPLWLAQQCGDLVDFNSLLCHMWICFRCGRSIKACFSCYSIVTFLILNPNFIVDSSTKIGINK